MALPAVEVAPNFKAALLVKLALPAVALSPKVMSPVLVKCVKLPAVALFRKFITVGPETKFWMIPELFVMPTPLMVNDEEGAGDRERARARVEHDAVDLRSRRDDGASYIGGRERCRVRRPIGRATGIQLVALFQSVLAGLAFQVALPAKLLLAVARGASEWRRRGKEGPRTRAQE